jgi:hypothetical protein
MPEVVRDGNYIVQIYRNDHPPAHVDVRFKNCRLRVFIAESGVTLGDFDGNPKAQDMRRALEIVNEHLEACLAKWKDIHGET